MSTPVLLNNIDHRDLRVAIGYAARFGDAVNQTRVLPTEFEAIQREYAIVLREDAREGYAAYALLGLEKDENLFLDGDRWDARTVPALHLRGPFSIGVPPEGQEGGPMIHVDPAHPRIDSTGEPIFREQGGDAPVLERASEALRRIYTGVRQAPALFAALAEAELIAPVTLELTLDDARRCTIPDCFTIATDRLDALGGAALEHLHRAGHLRAAIWIASSLDNVRHLLDRKLRRDARR
jgi:hypothetical protein